MANEIIAAENIVNDPAYNEKCIIVRNAKKDVYGRCKYCDLKLFECLAMQSYTIIFFIIALILAFLIYPQSSYVLAGGFIIILSLLFLGRIVDNKTNELIINEYHLKELSGELEIKVKERTKELEKTKERLEEQTEKLKEFTEKLVQSNRFKDLFTDILRHDLLNPVGIIKLATTFMEENKNLADSEEVAMVKRNVKKLEDIVRNASDYAKLELEEKLEFDELDLAEVMEKVIDDLELYFSDKGMKVKFSPDGRFKTQASPMIESVFINLLSNSIKYSPEGSEVKISIEDAKGKLQVSVADRGEGVPDEYKKVIFNRFTRKESGGIQGTGLGLTIVSRIVELHKGRVWVEDNPGGGSIFKVEIPS